MPGIPISLIVIAPILMGAVILALSLVPVIGLIRGLPFGKVRHNWYTLAALILFFIIGYLFYASELRGGTYRVSDVIVSSVFFLGACFVLLVNHLSHRTAQDILRMSALEQENITDATMGIHNRRYFEQRLKEEFDRARRYNLPLSLLMIDIDDFKQINDTSGHQTGDQVLQGMGRLLIESVRDTDIVTRYGGDEICIIATHAGDATALDLAKRLCSKIGDNTLADGTWNIRVTTSIGIATLNDTMNEASDLVGCADMALYRAKNEGKNRAAVYLSDPAGCLGRTTAANGSCT
ncbi:GGDEF domain-containing protein [Geobacter sp. AOG2]|uniref:GGDEF domain-containing protein n=1 Tax=Geobacter sp. AOG2 TaxID=1566347 RepID=UPI001CC5D325|nr:GGDEF domain-containing protein [Geobacter sp. AOG2]GFE61737.1 hypothetical protein AOG2_23240 [Geobacter sp. AOG2]